MHERPFRSLTAALALTALPAMAQTEPAPSPTRIEVQAESLAARDSKTVGDLAEAAAMFERFRALAPQAELRIRALTRKDREQADRLNIQVLAPAGRINVPVDELSRFRIDPSWAALPAETQVRSKLRDGEVAWRSDVRTPGLPPHVRRLGDLRLQCKLDWGTPLARRSLLPSSTSFVTAGALCESRYTGALNSQFADHPVLALDLVHGDRRERLSYFFLHGAGDNTPSRLLGSSLDWGLDLKDHMYRLPLQDESWPDDTRVEFIFMDPLALAPIGERP